MIEVKEINIKNQTFYFFDDMIDVKNFHSNLLKIDEKSHKGIDITSRLRSLVIMKILTV